jgi:hypothetical protein
MTSPTSSVRVLQELDYVQLARDVHDYETGTRGTVIAAHPDADSYTVELHDEEGETLEAVPCARLDLVLLQAAHEAAESRSTNGHPRP